MAVVLMAIARPGVASAAGFASGQTSSYSYLSPVLSLQSWPFASASGVAPLQKQTLESPTPESPTLVEPSHRITLETLERRLFDQVNAYRVSQGLEGLELNQRLSDRAREHSEAMAARRVPFGHAGFADRVRAIGRDIRYRRIGENVSYNQGFFDPTQRALDRWLTSSTHRDNLEGRYHLTGIGIARDRFGGFYMTQLFLRRR